MHSLGFLEELRIWCESVRSKCSIEDISKQVGLERWVGDSGAVSVLENYDLVFQALVPLNMTNFLEFTAALVAKSVL